MTRADLKQCGKIPDAGEELNRSIREGRIESRHSTKSLEGMGSSSHDLGAELRMHSFTVNCDSFSNEEKVAAVVPVTSVEVTCIQLSVLLMKCNAFTSVTLLSFSLHSKLNNSLFLSPTCYFKI